MRVGALQIAPVGLSPNRLDYYLRIAKAKEVGVMLLPEYVLNRFFHELRGMPRSMIAQQSQNQIEALKNLSKEYEITIVAPVVRVQKDHIVKSVGLFRPQRATFYDQQILIDYPHWNEERFFDNEPTNDLMIFRQDGLKFGVLPGYETHFDHFWQAFMRRGVDVALVPSASTFGSNQRWLELLKIRAFTNHLYVVRANRIGEYVDENDMTWKFYGQSFAIDPYGQVAVELGESEELLLQDISKERIKSAKKEWGFRSALKKRGML